MAVLVSAATGTVTVMVTSFTVMRGFRRDIKGDVENAINGVKEDIQALDTRLTDQIVGVEAKLTAEIRRVEGKVDEVGASVAALRERTSNIEGARSG